jgi:hypothetical protein
MNKKDELGMAKGLLDRIVADYDTMFREDGSVGTMGYRAMGCEAMRTCPTRVKEELRLVRRLLLEVANAL